MTSEWLRLDLAVKVLAVKYSPYPHEPKTKRHDAEDSESMSTVEDVGPLKVVSLLKGVELEPVLVGAREWTKECSFKPAHTVHQYHRYLMSCRLLCFLLLLLSCALE